jgi:hypothetical protein
MQSVQLGDNTKLGANPDLEVLIPEQYDRFRDTSSDSRNLYTSLQMIYDENKAEGDDDFSVLIEKDKHFEMSVSKKDLTTGKLGSSRIWYPASEFIENIEEGKINKAAKDALFKLSREEENPSPETEKFVAGDAKGKALEEMLNGQYKTNVAVYDYSRGARESMMKVALKDLVSLNEAKLNKEKHGNVNVHKGRGSSSEM